MRMIKFDCRATLLLRNIIIKHHTTAFHAVYELQCFHGTDNDAADDDDVDADFSQQTMPFNYLLKHFIPIFPQFDMDITNLRTSNIRLLSFEMADVFSPFE